MTTYTHTGFVMQENPVTDAVISFQDSQIEFVVRDGVIGFSSIAAGFNDDGFQLVQLDIDDYITKLDGVDITTLGSSADLDFITVSWSGGTQSAIIANIYDNATNKSYVFRLAGDDFPASAFASPAALTAFVQSVSVAAPPAGYQPGNFIAFSSLPGITSTENDTIPGTGAPESLFGGLGDDVIDGAGGDDYIEGNDGNDTLHGGAGSDTLDGGAGGLDAAVFDFSLAEAAFRFEGDTLFVANAGAEDTLLNIERLQFTDQTVTVSSLLPSETVTGDATSETLTTGGGDDVVDGGGGDDTIDGGGGDDRLIGGLGDDTIDGGDGADTLNGGDGADTLTGGVSVDDLRDIIYGGDGDDIIDGGYGNDLIYGMGGNDTIAGGFGVDELQGQDGDDVITGSAFSDLVFGGDGNDFVNGGFGSDRINGGTGADKFFHLGVLNHGSDWVQDYLSADGDVLLFGQTGATADQFQVNYAHTANAAGERAGDDAVQEAFVIYKPTGQIMWALIDGEGQDAINLQIAGASDVFDLA